MNKVAAARAWFINYAKFYQGPSVGHAATLMAEIDRLRARMIARGVNPDENLMEYYETPEGNIAIRPSSTNPPSEGVSPDPTQPELQQPLP